jgi:TRAP-type C4-dicarboxylate transport system substrate-binding protein
MPGKKLIWVLLLGVGLLFAADTGQGAEPGAAPYTIRIATIAPEGSYWSDFFQKAKMYVESRTRGRAKIVWYMSGVMGDEPEVIGKIRAGRLEGAVLTIVGLGMIDPGFRATMLPFLIQDYEEADFLLDSLRPRFESLLAEKGFLLMGFTEVGFNRLFSPVPIRSRKDFPGLKMWGWKGEKLIDMIFRDDLGLKNVVPLTLYEVKNSLEKGEINAYYAPCYAQVGLQWYRHARYMSDFTMGYTPAVFVLDQKFAAGLPGDIRSILEQAFDFILKPLRQVIREEEEKACQGLVRRGIIRAKSSPEFLAEMRNHFQKIHQKYAGSEYPPDMLQEINARLKEFRSR